MSIETLLELSDNHEVVDIWKAVDIFLDLRRESPELADAALAAIGVSEGGPSIILGERLRKITLDYKESL